MSAVIRSAAVSIVAIAAFLPAPAAFAQAQKGKKAADDKDRLEAAQLRHTKKLMAEFCADLDETARWAAKGGLGEEAKALVERLRKLDPEYKNLEKLSKAVAAPASPGPDTDPEKLKKTLSTRVEKAEAAHAGRLFSFALACMKAGLFTRAYDLLGETLKLSPDHKQARKALRQVWDPKEKKWISEWEKKQREKYVLIDEGWIPKDWKKKWDTGLRNYKDKWVSVEEEKRIRTRNEYDPFRVETEHFEVATNLGRKEAWEYAQLLEDFYGQFFRVFIGYYDQVAGAQLLFNQATAKKKHRVYLFPTHEDYLTHVKAEHGNQKLLRESAGFYSHGERISRFFWSQNLEATFHTMYHEVTHQLLGETKETSSGGSQGNNWVIEGIAVYAETWEKVGNEWFPGRKTGINELATAKGHLASGSGWKLSEFVRIDNDTFHKEGRGLNYAISGALAHFFMHYDDELHKEGFVRFLSAFYAGKVRDESLVEYLDLPSGLSTSEKFELVEKQFLEYMKGLQTS